MRPNEEQIAAVKAANASAELHLLEGESHAIIVRSPRRAEFKMFVAQADKGGAEKAVALEQLVRSCLVWPGQDELAVIFDDKPFLVAKFADQVSAIGGSEEQATRKKL